MLEDLHIEDGNFTAREMQLDKKNLNEGKQPGPDNIPPEVLKRSSVSIPRSTYGSFPSKLWK